MRLCYPFGVAFVVLGIFVATLAPTVTAEDSGELIAAAWHFGIPHPPAYPLWTMLCGAFLHLFPLGNIAFRANLFSALCSAAAAGVTCAAIRELGVRPVIAASAALIWILSRWSWSQSVITEVYALNSLLTAGVLWCALRWYRTRATRPLLVASLLMGLGMSNHHSMALAGLALVVWIILLSPVILKRWRLAGACIAIFLIGLLPYVYLPLRARVNPPMNWGNPSTLKRCWDHVARHQYGAVGPTKTAEPRSLSRLGPQLWYVGQSLADDLTPWLAVAGLVGLIFLAWRERRLFLLCLLWLACTGGLFVLLANFDLDRTSQWAMRVFLIPVSLGLVIPLAVLLDHGVHYIGTRLASRPWLVGSMAVGMAAVGPCIRTLSHWRQCDYSNYWYAHDHARNLLACMLPKALVFPSGDHSTFPLVYLTMVEHQRPDVLIADIYGYTRPDLYQDRPADAPDDPEAWLIKRARRPVYYTTKLPSPVEHAGFVQAGLLYHLLPEGKPFDPVVITEKCQYRNASSPTVVDFGASHIMGDYEFFRGLDCLERRDTKTALDHFAASAGYGHGIKEVYNNIGSALAEHGLTAEAMKYFRSAARLDSRYATPRWNLFRMCRDEGNFREARAMLEELMAADPQDPRPYGEMGFLLDRHLHDRAGAVRYWQESLRRNLNQPEVTAALNRAAGSNPAAVDDMKRK